MPSWDVLIQNFGAVGITLGACLWALKVLFEAYREAERARVEQAERMLERVLELERRWQDTFNKVVRVLEEGGEL